MLIGVIGGLPGVCAGAFWGGVIGGGRDQFVQVYDSREWTRIAPQLAFPLFPPTGGDDFSGVTVTPGDRVVVTLGDLSTSGTVVDVSASRLIVGAHEFEPSPNLTFRREGDPIWDGAAYGFLFGSTIGAAIDALHTGHTTVYADGHRKAILFTLKQP